MLSEVAFVLLFITMYVVFPAQIDPPAFAMSSTERSISVVVAPPEKWKGDPREKPEYLHQIYPDLQYNVSVFNKAIRKKARLNCFRSHF